LLGADLREFRGARAYQSVPWALMLDGGTAKYPLGKGFGDLAVRGKEAWPHRYRDVLLVSNGTSGTSRLV